MNLMSLALNGRCGSTVVVVHRSREVVRQALKIRAGKTACKREGHPSARQIENHEAAEGCAEKTARVEELNQ
jgi:mRNA-degrading endonuclease toxin of MazEF toxin-antitoxin module